MGVGLQLFQRIMRNENNKNDEGLECYILISKIIDWRRWFKQKKK